jgi:hypothetical protein
VNVAANDEVRRVHGFVAVCTADIFVSSRIEGQIEDLVLHMLIVLVGHAGRL